MRTVGNIELNLEESSFIYKYNEIKFYFSSEFYKNKFKEEVKNYIQMETAKIINKYKIEIDLTDFLTISLYKKIEKRGFLIEYKGNKLKKLSFLNILI